MINYWEPIRNQVKKTPSLLRTIPGFLLRPEKLIFYIGRTHIGVEYVGPERVNSILDSWAVEIVYHDYSLMEGCHILDEVIGFDYGDGALRLQLPPMNNDIVLPTNAGADELIRLNWNWEAQSMLLGFNISGLEVPERQFTRLINARFFDSSPTSGLRTRHVKWLDLIPCEYNDADPEFDSFKIWLSPYKKLAQVDLHAKYPIPEDFRLQRLQKMNRFIEFVGDKSKSEPEITKLLATEEFKFALKMRFSAQEVYSECLCEWQSEDRKAIKPDFFVVGSDGYADLVEFKLPSVKSSPVVGIKNRESFSSEISSYVSQTRVYRDYFDDPNNQKYIKEKFGFDVYKPKRHLVIGRRWDFDNRDWRSIAADFPDLSIHTYDDLIDGVVMQFYD